MHNRIPVLNLMPDPTEMEQYDDPSKPHDVDVLIQSLCEWSKELGVNWRIEFESELFGEIVGGRCLGDLSERIQAITGCCSKKPRRVF
jgi:hypothetical protein